MESGEIKDSQISASSEEYSAQNGRLNFKRNKSPDAWSARGSDSNPWLKVDFENLVVITEVLTQGRGDFRQWVTAFTLSYSNGDDEFEQFTENGVQKVN